MHSIHSRRVEIYDVVMIVTRERERERERVRKKPRLVNHCIPQVINEKFQTTSDVQQRLYADKYYLLYIHIHLHNII